MQVLEIVAGVERARVLMDPVRQQILALAREPISASQAAQHLRQRRQNVNYHFKALEHHRFLDSAGEFRKGNMIEKRFQATAHHYLLLPSVLGELVGGLREKADRFSAAHLLGLTVELQRQLARVLQKAAQEDRKVATVSFATDLRFESPEQRTQFTEALLNAVRQVVQEHSSPARSESGKPAVGRLFRLMLGCHPLLEDWDRDDPTRHPLVATNRSGKEKTDNEDADS